MTVNLTMSIFYKYTQILHYTRRNCDKLLRNALTTNFGPQIFFLFKVVLIIAVMDFCFFYVVIMCVAFL